MTDMKPLFKFGDLEISVEDGYIFVKDLASYDDDAGILMLPSEAAFLLEKLPAVIAIAKSQALAESAQ